MTDYWPEPEEAPVGDLAAEVEALKAEIADARQAFQQQLEARDRAAEMVWAAARQPEPVSVPREEIAAETPVVQQPTRPRLTADQIAAATREAMAVTSATVPGWSEVSKQVVDHVKGDPSRLGQLAGEGSLAVASYLASLAQSERSRADTRAMKLQAQTMTGAGGRLPAPDDAAQRWAEIMNAESGKLGL